MALIAFEVRPARRKASTFSTSQYGTPNRTELVAGRSPVRFLARRYLSEMPFAWGRSAGFAVVCQQNVCTNFLPWVHSPNLASRVLGLVCRRLASDWFSHYGYRPVLLETFVQRPRFTGTAYRAANWRCVGFTKGRGKLEKHHQAILPTKAIFLYPLHPDFKEILTR